jgi:hypothetical protein
MRKLLALLFAAASLQAQSVRGTVADAGGIRVPGVVVQLLTANDSVVSRALTDVNGAFLVATPNAGDYRVRTLRIGYKAITSEVITLAAGQQVTRQFELTGVAVTLSGVKIEGESVCRRSADDSTNVVFQAWDQLRTAISATQISAFTRPMTITSVDYTRFFDGFSKKLVRNEATLRTAQARQPWAERRPELLRREGYVVKDMVGNYDYHVPGLDALGSPMFIEDHCLRLSRASSAERLGVEFTPTRERSETPEVRGTAWLDRKTSELRQVDFSYVNLPPERMDLSGGRIEFTRMTDGTWIVSRWFVRMPVLKKVDFSASMGGPRLQIDEVQETGAQLSVARRGQDTLWMHPPLPLSGTVIDSATNRPAPGAVAKLVGTAWLDTTDARGRFTIRAVPGEYTLEVTTPSLDSVKAVHQSKITFIDSASALEVKVPNADFIRRVMNARNSAAFMGQVLTDSTNQPVRDAEVSLPALSKTVKTDSLGMFRISDVPAGVQRVVVRKVGMGAYDAPTYFMAGHAVQRKILLPKVTELASVTVTAEAGANLPASFEDHRKAGLGNFVTRAMIDRYKGMTLQSLLDQTPSVSLITGNQRQAWLTSGRMPPPRISCVQGRSLYGANTYCPEPFEQMKGMRPACYAQVWLDRMLMNPENPTMPFDVNSIAPELVEAMEYYAGPAQTPPEYSRMNSTCGVLVIHTRKA